VGIDGERVAASNELRNRVAMKLPGETVELQFVRDGTEHTVSAVLGARQPQDPGDQESDVRPSRTSGPLDGMQFLAETEPLEGIVVRAIAQRSLAERADVRPGDLIVAINRKPVDSVDEAMRLADQTWTVVLEIMRDVEIMRDGEIVPERQRLLAVLR
jgi:S1-C subfamily serine protease